MPRSKRIVVPGLPHHITQRGNGRAQVFDGDRDRAVFLDLLAGYAQQYGLSIWGYCLMSNHFHLVAVPAHEGATAKVLGRLEADYARFLNVRRRSCGHLWQARYHSVAAVKNGAAVLLGGPGLRRTQSDARGDEALVERLEKELGRRLRRGKAGRPRKQQANAAQPSFFVESV